MTILNLHLEKDRALVAVNTQAVLLTGEQVNNSAKVFVLPHANAVIAFSGPIATGISVYLDCCSSFRGLDDLFKVFESFVDRRCAEMKRDFTSVGVRPTPNFLCALVGWSPRWAEVVGMLYDTREAAPLSLARSFVSPAEAHWPERSHEWPCNVAEMIATAKYQAHHADIEFPGQPWRGDLTLTEITRDVITISSAKDFSATDRSS